MDTQIILGGFETPEQKELLYLDSIFSALKSAVTDHGGDPALLTYKSTKSDGKSNSSGYTVVSFGTLTAFRLRLRGNQHYISVPTLLADLIPDDFPKKQAASEPKYVRLLVDEEHPLSSYADFLIAVAGATVNRYPKEWDCCSRYLECSDAKTCVHPDKTFALGCGYRKILNSGRIFYGKNRNVD